MLFKFKAFNCRQLRSTELQMFPYRWKRFSKSSVVNKIDNLKCKNFLTV